MRSFKEFHPLTQALFFISVLIATMFDMHPILLMISIIAAALYTGYIGGIKALLKTMELMLVTSIMIIIINPLISHEGITVLAKLPDGNDLTLESIIFAAAAALMMSGAVYWFYCINRTFTSDRIIYLFGKITPKLALMISMTLNFMSKFKSHLEELKAARYSEKTSSKLINSINIISSLLQWSAENAVDTADSMKSRGYGLKKRTGYTRFKLTSYDVVYMLIILLADFYLWLLISTGNLSFSYYPFFEIESNGITAMSGYIVYAVLCVIPFFTDVKGDIKWRYMTSKL